MVDSTLSLIQRLFEERRGALDSFFSRRIRRKQHASDLTQEVYLRMLRVPDREAIRNPEGYLFAVAANLLKEHWMAEHRELAASIAAASDPVWSNAFAPDGDDAETEHRIRRIDEALEALSPRCQAAIELKFRHGLRYEQIAERMGISRNMVKKYLVQGLAQCRLRVAIMDEADFK